MKKKKVLKYIWQWGFYPFSLWVGYSAWQENKIGWLFIAFLTALFLAMCLDILGSRLAKAVRELVDDE